MARKARKRIRHVGPRGGVYYMSKGRRVYPNKARKVKWGKAAKH